MVESLLCDKEELDGIRVLINILTNPNFIYENCVKTQELIPNRLEYRMYCLVLRQLSGINKGIQSCHCCLEYANKFSENQDYQKYVNFDKTLIMLDAGTTVDMDEIIEKLKSANINFATFEEPDLGNLTTCVCFLADERSFDKTKYSSKIDFLQNFNLIFCESSGKSAEEHWKDYIGGDKVLAIMDIISNKRLSI